jgi:hypothetical protein
LLLFFKKEEAFFPDGKAHMNAERSAEPIAPQPPPTPLPRLAFVHIPKTAGTSVTGALERGYGSQMFPGMTTLDYRCFSDEQLTCYRLFKGHAYRADYMRLPADTIRFTVLRDPVRRAMSFYAYCRGLDVSHINDDFMREACRVAASASAIDFVYSDSPFVIEHLRLGQVRQFLSAETLARIAHRQFLTRALRQQAVREFISEMQSFRYVLTCEALSLSFPLMMTCLGLPPPCAALGHDNASERTADIDPADVRRALVDVNAAEFECYEYVRAREQAWLLTMLGPRASKRGRLAPVAALALAS